MHWSPMSFLAKCGPTGSRDHRQSRHIALHSSTLRDLRIAAGDVVAVTAAGPDESKQRVRSNAINLNGAQHAMN